MRNAYNLVRIREGDEWKTAFNSSSAQYKYLVIPLSLTNAPAVFKALVNDVLSDMLNKFVSVVSSNHVRRVLTRLLENQLYVKAEKCVFFLFFLSFLCMSTVPFLGMIISQG